VCAEPEVEIRQISADNPFLVIASDGVFEFLSDQDVVNMVPSSPKPSTNSGLFVLGGGGGPSP